jgi:hypothetical protein
LNDYLHTIVQNTGIDTIDRAEAVKNFKPAILAAIRKGAWLYDNLDELRSLFIYLNHIAERGEYSPNSCENTKNAMKYILFVLQSMYGESSFNRKKVIENALKTLRKDFPIPSPYQVPYIDNGG